MTEPRPYHARDYRSLVRHIAAHRDAPSMAYGQYPPDLSEDQTENAIAFNAVLGLYPDAPRLRLFVLGDPLHPPSDVPRTVEEAIARTRDFDIPPEALEGQYAAFLKKVGEPNDANTKFFWKNAYHWTRSNVLPLAFFTFGGYERRPHESVICFNFLISLLGDKALAAFREAEREYE